MTPDLYFWRDSTGLEIDAVQENGTKLTAIEIKSGKTFAPDFLDGLNHWMQFAGKKSGNCLVIYAGDMRLTHKGVKVIDWGGVTASII